MIIAGPRNLVGSLKVLESKTPMFTFNRAVMNNPTSVLPTNAQEFLLRLRKKLA